ncbi:thiamine-phosphate pyrophosphorylase [Methylophilaceae bacterium]|nr:thiamine-phosphate pyrophosphorylase [Methylophilaceae bacterium]
MAANNPGNSRIRGLYAITPDLTDTQALCRLIESSILGGASVIQYRNKRADEKLRIEQSRALLDICRRHQVPLIINDHVKLCLAVGADGVHVGGADGNLEEARACLGNDKILGTSCYNSLSLALEAQGKGADYVAFGACFPSETKPQAPKADISLFTKAQGVLAIPKVAIGGITQSNASQVIDAGAEAIAVISALFSAQDIALTAWHFTRLFNKSNHHDFTEPATI